jgi:hypothetical protein
MADCREDNDANSAADERHSKSTSCASSSTSSSSTDDDNDEGNTDEGREDDTADEDDDDEDDVTDDDVSEWGRDVSEGEVVGEVVVAVVVRGDPPDGGVVVGRSLPSVVASMEVPGTALAIDRRSWKSIS